MTSTPVVLCILDGWGHRENSQDNAIAQARTPNWDALLKTCPHSLLETSGEAVGLPEGQMGNSEVGHMTIGSGRVILQDLPRINRAITTGELAQNPALLLHIETLRKSGGTSHVMGLLSDGGVHAHEQHILALVKIIADAGIPVAIHAFMDGRDTPPRSGLAIIEAFSAAIDSIQNASIATVSGRYYAMDRDKRWDRVQKAVNAIASAQGEQTDSAVTAVQHSYDTDKTDEFVLPTVIANYNGMHDGDGLMMCNFRADRAREILTVLTDATFHDEKTGLFGRPKALSICTGMVEYSEALNPLISALFPAVDITESLGEVVAQAGLTQLRISETEKYAHVTFFFNGGKEDVFTGEERIMIPSPDVATYDLKPEMSASEVTEVLERVITERRYDTIIVNYANTDMVGHTGDMNAAIKAVETIDTCLGRLETVIRSTGGTMIITADHGNAELMVDEITGQPHTAHTVGRVPCVLVSNTYTRANTALDDGTLADLAPTLLTILKLNIPSVMDGHSLLREL